jgi:hypothetical protein
MLTAEKAGERKGPGATRKELVRPGLRYNWGMPRLASNPKAGS